MSGPPSIRDVSITSPASVGHRLPQQALTIPSGQPYAGDAEPWPYGIREIDRLASFLPERGQEGFVRDLLANSTAPSQHGRQAHEPLVVGGINRRHALIGVALDDQVRRLRETYRRWGADVHHSLIGTHGSKTHAPFHRAASASCSVSSSRDIGGCSPAVLFRAVKHQWWPRGPAVGPQLPFSDERLAAKLAT